MNELAPEARQSVAPAARPWFSNSSNCSPVGAKEFAAVVPPHIFADRHVLINGKRVNVRSYLVAPGDTVTISRRMKNNPDVQQALRLAAAGKLPAYLDFDEEALTGTLVRVPKRAEIPVTVQESAIVEFYAKA